MGPDAAIEREVRRAAAERNGRLKTRELYDLGLSPCAIRTRVRRGLLTREKHGVYAVGDPDAYEHGREAAALAAAGQRAALSHQTAAYIQGMRKHRPSVIAITVVGRKLRSWPGVMVHNVSRLGRRDVTTVKGLNVTSPARTVLDCAAQATQNELESLVDEGRAKHLLTPDDLHNAMARYPRRPGARTLKAILQDEQSGGTRSRAERELRKIIREGNLKEPETNAEVGTYTVDVLWRQERLIVEFDGFGTHGTRQSFEEDRARDRALTAQGYTILRVTYRQLTQRPQQVLAEIAAALALARARAA